MNSPYVDDFDGNNVLDMAAFSARVECEVPNNRLDRFSGTLDWKRDKEGKSYSINNDNILLRGMTLRNVNWAFGLVVFAGPDSKLMQNTGKTHFKRTSIDNFLNKLVIYIGITLILLAVISAGSVFDNKPLFSIKRVYYPKPKLLSYL